MLTPRAQPATRLGWALKVGGVHLTSRVPLDLGALPITESVGSPSAPDFTVEDTTGNLSLANGLVVTLERVRRNAAGESQTVFRYFGGTLVRRALRPRPAVGRFYECTAMGYEQWLDWKLVPNFTSRVNVSGRVRKIDSDRAIVLRLVNNYGGIVSGSHDHVDQTNAAMSVVHVSGVTLREAIERVADVATVVAPESPRDFYVDHYGRLHYYAGSEGLAAPYRIADGSYTRKILVEGSLAGLFPLREASGATAWSEPFGATGTFAGGYTRGAASLVPNEPHLTSTRFVRASSGYLAINGANFHPGDTWSVEAVFKRATLGTLQTLVSAGAGDYLVEFTTGNRLRVSRDGVGDNFLSDATFTDPYPHHLLITREPGNTDVYLDGQAITGTVTARTFVSAHPGDVNWGRNVAGTAYFDGWLSHLAHYTVRKTASDALVHYQQLVSLTPEGLEVTYDSSDQVHRVYVKGKNRQGTGWVDPGTASFSGHKVEAYLDEEDSTTTAKRNAYGRAFIRQHNRLDSLRFSVLTGVFGDWALGQLVTITSSALSLAGLQQELRELVTEFNLGSGVISYEMVLGDPRPAQFRRGRRRRRRG